MKEPTDDSHDPHDGMGQGAGEETHSHPAGVTVWVSTAETGRRTVNVGLGGGGCHCSPARAGGLPAPPEVAASLPAAPAHPDRALSRHVPRTCRSSARTRARCSWRCRSGTRQTPTTCTSQTRAASTTHWCCRTCAAHGRPRGTCSSTSSRWVPSPCPLPVSLVVLGVCKYFCEGPNFGGFPGPKGAVCTSTAGEQARSWVRLRMW